ncbi:ataxin-3 [Plasmodium gonderi]|uniref:ubiquitinyl hydrolase 1 n=1 Tax=Plasmodium gonderi TaxID=77519 RepID=A0A1Y1JUQ6_PLAGO|nr:ataxin-3 [Plasmodium gonderi]GAW83644.1 ataxin-3 [Plasmodium gonderi]
MSKKYVYWEKQGNDRMCGLHCINTILQGPHYSEDILATIGREIDEKEREFLKVGLNEGNNRNELIRNNSSNVLDDGFINISVLIECLKRKNILLKNTFEDDLKKIISSDHQDIGYICNLEQHWFSIRKIHNTWYVLDSLKSGPLYIKDINLKYYFNDIIKKYHVFSVQNMNPYISLPKADINFETKNPNQFYISTNEISEIYGVSNGFIMEDKFHSNNRANQNSLFSSNFNDKSNKFKWPEVGGRKLNDTDLGRGALPTSSYDADDELQIALRLSVQEYIKNLAPPAEEEPSSEDNFINFLVKFSNKKIHKKFSVTKTMTDVFYWLEYESANIQDFGTSLLMRNSYNLCQMYPRRKFCKYQNGTIELHVGDKIEQVQDKLLVDLKFEKEETFMLS